MKYKFSKLCTLKDDGNVAIIESHLNNSTIELFEQQYLDEFRALQSTAIIDNLNSDLREILFEEKILVENDFNEFSFIFNISKDFDEQSISLIIFPTENCNLRCIYCYETFRNRELSKGHYDLLLNTLINKVNHENKKNINISWFGGEPLLKFGDIVYFNKQVMQAAEEKNAYFSSSITTNGVLLDLDTLYLLCQNGVYEYQITLDGFFHDGQCVFPDGKGSFDIIYKNIICMLESDLDFRLLLRVNIPDKEFDFSFYDLFSNYAEDKRLHMLIRPVGKWGESDFNLPVFGRKSGKDAMKVHNKYLRNLGFSIFDDGNKGLLSGSCYAAQKDSFVIRADGKIGKCTVALDHPLNNVGHLDLKNSEFVIEDHKQSVWINNALTNECRKCIKMATCYNRSCPLVRINNKTTRCCDRSTEV